MSIQSGPPLSIIPQIIECAEAFKKTSSPRKYIVLTATGATITNNKDSASSFKDVITACQLFARRPEFRNDKNFDSFRQAITTLIEHFKEKPAPWYYRIPLISWVYNGIKNNAIREADILQRQLLNGHKENCSTSLFCLAPSHYYSKNEEEAIKALNSEEAGSIRFWITDDARLAYAIKPFGRKLQKSDSTTTDANVKEYPKILSETCDFHFQVELLRKEGKIANNESEAKEQLKKCAPGDYRLTILPTTFYLKINSGEIVTEQIDGAGSYYLWRNCERIVNKHFPS